MSALRSLEDRCSSLQSQVCHEHIKQAKYRSFIPSVISLLVRVNDCHSTTELSNKFDDALVMEDPYGNQDVTEIQKMKEKSLIFKDAHKRQCKVCKLSNRSEDIYVREDENGVRSHICPLNMEEDGEKDENEDNPHPPMQQNYDMNSLLKSFSLKSDEIPYLMAERPPSTDSVSTVSSGNTVNEDSDLQFLVKDSNHTPKKRLHKELLDHWMEESSDENSFFDPSQKNSEISCHKGMEEESDMEEFVESSEEETDRIKTKDHQENRIEKNSDTTSNRNFNCFSCSLLDSIVSEKKSSEFLINYSKLENPENGNANQSESQNPTLRTEGEDENNESGNLVSQSDSVQNQSVHEKTKNKNSTCHETSSLNSPEIEQEPDSFARNIPNPDKNTDEISNCNTNMVKDSKDSISQLTDSPRGEIIPLEKDENDENVERTMIVMPDAELTTEEKSENRENLADSLTKSETDIKSEKVNKMKGANKMKKANLTMEPVAMNFEKRENIQPDLATSLRFMTEVYSTKDDEEFYDTLNELDIPTVMSLAERADKVINADKYQKRFQEKDSINRSIERTSPYMSGAFEPALTEEKKAALRPRSKFTKFFKSIKKKFEKKE